MRPKGPRAPRGQPPYHDLVLPSENVSFDIDRIEDLVRSHGVTCEVYSAMYCPIEVDDADDARTHTHPNCQNGFLYRYEGQTTVTFTGNSTAPEMTEYGTQDSSYVRATFPLYYDDCPDKPVILGQYYRVYISDCPTAVVNSEKIEHHQSGLDRLSYPVESVLRLTDNRGREYHVGQDFDLTPEGLIQWRPNKSPGYNPTLGRGVVISCLYEYKPFYYVARLPHEIRVSRKTNPMTGNAEVVRMQSEVALQREWMFSQSVRDEADDGRGNTRSLTSPRSGGFGPR